MNNEINNTVAEVIAKKELYGAAKAAHDKKVAREKAIERKHKAVVASMKSREKFKKNMTEDELKAWRKKQSEASMKSYKARLAKMTEAELAEYKAARNAKAKAKREAKKVKLAEANAVVAAAKLEQAEVAAC